MSVQDVVRQRKQPAASEADPSAPSVTTKGATSGNVEMSLYPQTLQSINGARAVQIVRAKEDHTFELDEEALTAILCSEEVRNKKVAVLSIAGAFRKGKSFLLDFLLRYMERSGQDSPADAAWMGQEDEPLVGFQWRSGTKRDTTGILMWSKPFIITTPGNEEVAVLLMDTQGAFDNQSTVKDCATIFALSTMVSSVQVYNLSMLINENDLQHLHLFTDYGRLAMESSSDIKPFQSLCFLVRDWSNPDEYPYGLKDGEKYLNEEVLKILDSHREENKLVRNHIGTCFESVSCFLMPHPGLKVATNKSFTGQLKDIDDEFKKNLVQLVPYLLEPKNIVLKKINGNTVTGRGLLELFKSYIKIFGSDVLPAPKSVLEATAEANNLAAQAAALDKFNHDMEELCGAEKPYLSSEKLQQGHDGIKAACLDQFRSTRKLGGESYSKAYEEKLIAQMVESYEAYVKRNEGKNIMNAYRTPGVLLIVMAIAYFVSSILSMIGIESLSRTAIFGLYVPLALMVLWGYIKYSGNFSEAGQMIDNMAGLVWEEAVQPAYTKLMERGLQQAVKLSTQGIAKPKRE